MKTERSLLYKLNKNKEVVPCHNLLEWAKFFENIDNRIVALNIINKMRVSTIFMGVLCPPFDKPNVFETIVFKGRKNIYCDRYSTWEKAEKGHKKAIEWIKNWCKEETQP